MSLHPKPLILVDGSSYLYRAFHALPALVNSKGFPTGAIYGMTNMLKRLIADYQPDYMAVIFDTKGKTFRDDLYQAYKATRQPMPDELSQQITPIFNIIKAMGIALIQVEGVEADDVIGTLVHYASQNKISSVVSTGDKDLAQLVNRQVTLINTMTNTKLDPEGVKEKFGISPEHFIDYLTLVGDSSDNIPGVEKVGPKTAVKWLKEYGSLKQLIVNAEKITGKVGENFRAFIPQVPLTQQLVTIKTDVPLSIEIADLKIKTADKKILIDIYKELEFKNWLAELLDATPEKNQNKYDQYQIITDKKGFADFLKKLEQAELIAFTTETTQINYMLADMVGISFAINPQTVCYIPLAHDSEKAPSQLSKEYVLATLKPFFENPKIKKVAQNLKFDIEMLYKEQIQIKGIIYDTMLESYLLDSASNSHDLNSLALKYLGLRTITYEEVAGSGSKEIPFNQVDLQKAGTYAAEEADITLQLHHQLHPRILKEPGLKKVFEEIEIPLISVLATMECTGVLIDPALLKQQGIELEKRLKILEQEAFTLANCTFNINSPKQLQEILFQKLNLPVLQKTPTGQPSTADPILQELALEFALPKLIIEYRSLSKLISTYTSKLITQINPKTKRIHTSYNQTGTATGRLSSSEPNLQNIPIRTVEGRRIRQAFIAPNKWKLISADYSQIELRLIAHISNDPQLIEAFRLNQDIHQATAAEVWEVPIDQVTSEMRRNAKAINFGLIYGMSAFGLTKQLGITRFEAQKYIDRYFDRYPAVRQYMNNIQQKAKREGFVETLWGRRLYLPDINSKQMMRQKAAERIAINAPLQGSAADIIKLAMIHIDQWLRKEKLSTKMLMQVHDELVFEVPEQEIEQATAGIRQYMSEVVTLKVPLIVQIGVGQIGTKPLLTR